MVNKEYFSALAELCAVKGIEIDSFKEVFVSAIASAYKKEISKDRDAKFDVKVDFDDVKCTLKFYAVKKVVEVVTDPNREISLEEARETKKSYKIGDEYKKEFVPKNFSRQAISSAKQIISQKISEVDKKNVMQEYVEKESEIQQCIVRRIEGETVYVELSNKDGYNKVEGIMPVTEQVKGETYQVGDKLMVYVKKSRTVGNETQITVSRTSIGLVKRFFENEVPEIRQGIVVIKSIAREPGSRCKIAIMSIDPNVDALGACVGNKGERVNAVISELNGEKIDIIMYSEDPLEFIANALAPSKVLRVTATGDKSARAIVPDDKLSLAIGKDGQNAKLAYKLTGWKIDVKSESKAMEEIQKQIDNGEIDIDRVMTQEEIDALMKRTEEE